MYQFSTEANCIGVDVDMFFTQEKTKQYAEPELLKRICDNCVVKVDCFEYALTHAVNGWWGGTSDMQRIRMRKAKGITAVPVLVSEKWVS